MIERSLEVKLPTIWTDGKAEVGRVKEEKKREDQRGDRVRRKKMQKREKVGKSRFTVFFQWFVALEGRKVGSLKQRVRSQLARWETKNCTPVWPEAHFQVKSVENKWGRGTFGSWDVEKKCTRLWHEAHFQLKSVKNWRGRSTFFGSWDVEKVYAVVARSTCSSQNVESTPFLDHLWQWKCRKSAGGCGAKHISKSKC